jgi:hypothetical protein
MQNGRGAHTQVTANPASPVAQQDEAGASHCNSVRCRGADGALCGFPGAGSRKRLMRIGITVTMAFDAGNAGGEEVNTAPDR